MNIKPSCKGTDGTRCEYDSSWFCRHPACKGPVLTSTLPGARPSGCPKVDEWNRKNEDESM